MLHALTCQPHTIIHCTCTLLQCHHLDSLQTNQLYIVFCLLVPELSSLCSYFAETVVKNNLRSALAMGAKCPMGHSMSNQHAKWTPVTDFAETW